MPAAQLKRRFAGLYYPRQPGPDREGRPSLLQVWLGTYRPVMWLMRNRDVAVGSSQLEVDLRLGPTVYQGMDGSTKTRGCHIRLVGFRSPATHLTPVQFLARNLHGKCEVTAAEEQMLMARSHRLHVKLPQPPPMRRHGMTVAQARRVRARKQRQMWYLLPIQDYLIQQGTTLARVHLEMWLCLRDPKDWLRVGQFSGPRMHKSLALKALSVWFMATHNWREHGTIVTHWLYSLGYKFLTANRTDRPNLMSSWMLGVGARE